MILVTGARGHVARSVVTQLLEAGARVRAAGRDPEAVRAPAGVELVHADLARPETLGSALSGTFMVFLYAESGGLDGFTAAARDAGVKHIVLLSAAGASATGDDPIAWMHGAAERVVAGSGIAWTFLRPGGFATNTLQWAESIRAEGVVRDPFPEAQGAAIHEADIAAVAVRTLTEPGHEERTYTLTGPESLTMRRHAELIGEAIGREVRFVDRNLAEYRRAMLRWGSEEVADALIRRMTAAVDHPAEVTDTVAEVTGRPGRTFAEWARDHAADFR